MENREREKRLILLADEYNHPKYFLNDPIRYPRHFYQLYKKGEALLQDIEISALLCSHLAWGRREMIVRDCGRLMDEMEWAPYSYIMRGHYREDQASLHRTVKWIEISKICRNLKEFYSSNLSMEILSPEEMRTEILGRKADLKAANKKIHMFRRWMVRDDNLVDIGIWKNSSPANLIIPLDVHVHRGALELKITTRKSVDITTAKEITAYLERLFPGDPCKGDFALFASAASDTKK
jgi:uncharacterized protein (TIGR02757 family)